MGLCQPRFSKVGWSMVQAGGSYLAQMLGTVPKDVVGYLGGDYLRHVRIRNWYQISEKTFRDLEDVASTT